MKIILLESQWCLLSNGLLYNVQVDVIGVVGVVDVVGVVGVVDVVGVVGVVGVGGLVAEVTWVIIVETGYICNVNK